MRWELRLNSMTFEYALCRYSLTSSYQSQFGAEDNSEHDTSGADGSSGNKVCACAFPSHQTTLVASARSTCTVVVLPHQSLIQCAGFLTRQFAVLDGTAVTSTVKVPLADSSRDRCIAGGYRYTTRGEGCSVGDDKRRCPLW